MLARARIFAGLLGSAAGRRRLAPYAEQAAALGGAVTIGASALLSLDLPMAIELGCGALSAIGVAGAFVRHRTARATRTRLAAECAALRDRLLRDPLTNLMNRAAFQEALSGLAASEVGMTILIFFDLDRFKDVNDTAGHEVGDQLLVQVARRIEKVLTGATVFARLGGDEFAAILPYGSTLTPEDHGLAIVEAINEPFLIQDRVVEVSASVGIAVGDPAGAGANELLRRADVAMYEAKGARRGACRVFDDVLDGRQIREGTIRVELGKSLLDGELALHYQPLVDARTGAFSSAEALLRPCSNALGDVAPSMLISIAEESGQILPLTDWTLDTALAAIRSLDGVPVAVNISPIYFRHPDFIHRVFDKLLAARVRPDLLTLEVTEGVLIADIDTARHSIVRLREIGVRVFLDDFGTGYSSLSYLQHFEMDGLKLDKSFLRDVGDKRRTTQIIRSMIDFGHSLDMRVVVEGVESDWQARLLQLLGCDLLQGYEIGMPMPLADLHAYRTRHPLPSLVAAAPPVPPPAFVVGRNG